MNNNKLSKILLRLKLCHIVLFGQLEHWIILSVGEKELMHLLKDEPYKINSYYNGLRPFMFFKMIQDFADTKDEVELICDKAIFDSKVFEIS